MIRFEFIDQHREQFEIRIMCRLLEVSRSGYYAWRKRAVSQREIANQQLFEEIRRVFHENRQVYGAVRIWKALNKDGINCGRDRVSRLMKENQLKVKQPKRRVITTKSDKAKTPAPNLLVQQFVANGPNQKWCSDITYIPTDDGWLFLAVTLDLYSRKVVGWAMDRTMTSKLVCDAYQMALTRRKPEPGLIHHSDRGSQYTSHDFQTLITSSKAIPSMSATGNCYDNAVVESFFGTLKGECVPQNGYEKRAIGKSDIFTYIEGFYNRKRLHSTIDFCSPEEFENIYWKNQFNNNMTSSRVH